MGTIGWDLFESTIESSEGEGGHGGGHGTLKVLNGRRH